MNAYWQIQPEWRGATAFIVGGGPSVAAIDLESLRGQKIIVINSSFRAVPFADFLIFADARWWEHNRAHLVNWKGRIICLSHSPHHPALLMIKRKVPPASDQGNDCLALQFTTATAALDLAAKLGAARIVMLGVDGRNGADGKTHHHIAHPWRPLAGWEAKHRRDLEKMAEPLKNRSVEVVVATPSAYEDIWPRVELAELLQSRVALVA